MLFAGVLIFVAACQSDTRETEAASDSQPVSAGMAVQLWSVRDRVATDFEGTLSAIAEMGFEGVEFARDYGPYDDDPDGLRTFLDELGLRATSAHVPFEMLEATAIEDTVRFFQALDVSTLIIAYDERAWDPERVDALISELNAASLLLASSGMRIGYHNHDREFDAFGSATFWDYIASETREEVVLQLDIGWVVYANQDPLSFIRRNPGRITTAHYKISPRPDQPVSPILGDDDLDWRALTDVAIVEGGLDWIIIEQETYPDGLSALESVRASKLGLDRSLRP